MMADHFEVLTENMHDVTSNFPTGSGDYAGDYMIIASASFPEISGFDCLDVCCLPQKV